MHRIPYVGISVRSIYQATLTTCGAASAQMILHTIRAITPSQGNLFNEIQHAQKKDKSKKPPWASSPDGLTSTLNRHRPPGFHSRFNLFASTRENECLIELIWTIYKYRVPSVVLINSGGHWIVVYDFWYVGTKLKIRSDIDIGKINGFYLRDPLEKNSSQKYVDFIGYVKWSRNYLETVRGGVWNNNYVAICDPDPKKKSGVNKLKQARKTGVQEPDQKIADSQKLRLILEEPVIKKNPLEQEVPYKQDLPDAQKNPYSKTRPFTQKVPVSQTKVDPKIAPNKRKKLMNKEMTMKTNNGKPVKTMPVIRFMKIGFAKQVMTYKSAKEIAVWRLKYGGFYNPESVHLIMKKSTAGQPQLVMDLKNNNYYYCVPLKENMKIYANMILNAADGELLECLFAIRRNLPLQFAPLKKKAIIGMIKKYDASIKVKPNMIQPSMVWKYCNESTTMFLPFYQIKRGKTSLYVRMDREVFRKLTIRFSNQSDSR